MGKKTWKEDQNFTPYMARSLAKKKNHSYGCPPAREALSSLSPWTAKGNSLFILRSPSVQWGAVILRLHRSNKWTHVQAKVPQEVVNLCPREDKIVIPQGKFYLGGDAAFPLKHGLITPYRGVCYHLKEY
ncbi:hypothetical protein K1719_001454 [Acacia pycnantha]|nr:hypothetical protein K1719_001454 [Acacia pycnantha]